MTRETACGAAYLASTVFLPEMQYGQIIEQIRL